MNTEPTAQNRATNPADEDRLIAAVEPSSLGRPALNVSEMAQLEAEIAQRGTSLSLLMERAGRAIAHAALDIAKSRFPQRMPSVAILCGSGNNGGDGWVAARELAAAGCEVALACLCSAAEITASPASEQASITMQAAKNLPSLKILPPPCDDDVQAMLGQADMAIDAMLGTGFSGDALREPYADWTHALNGSREKGLFVIAADTPSGLSAQTGKAACPCVKADETISMIAPKPGLETPYAFAFCGELLIAPLADAEEPIDEILSRRRETQNQKAQRSASSGRPAKDDPFRRAENEDDDGYDPYSDRPAEQEPLFEENPWN